MRDDRDDNIAFSNYLNKAGHMAYAHLTKRASDRTANRLCPCEDIFYERRGDIAAFHVFTGGPVNGLSLYGSVSTLFRASARSSL